MAFERISRELLLLHLLAAIAAGASAVHLALRGAARWRGESPRAGLERLHAKILLISYTLTWSLGLLIYPTFRIRVRAALLDPHLPWATGLFEAKEHLATIGLAVVWALAALVHALPGTEPGSRDCGSVPLVAVLVVVSLGLIAWCAGSGWYLTCLKAV